MAKHLLLRLCHTFFRLCTGMNWALPVFSADVLLLIVIYFFPFFFSFGITPEARSIWGLIDDHLHKHDSRACRSRFSIKFLEALFYDLTWWWWWWWFNFRTRFTTSLNIFLIFFFYLEQGLDCFLQAWVSRDKVALIIVFSLLNLKCIYRKG